MAEAVTSPATGRCAIVTGANKGIGLKICRQLAAKGIMVVLTARDMKKGDEALDILRGYGLSDFIVFHYLDVTDAASIASLVDFTKTRFGKLDILLNNAGFHGLDGDVSAIRDNIMAAMGVKEDADQDNANGTVTENYELAEKSIHTNYHGVKRMIEAFIPLLQLSSSPRIVNLSSSWGKLMFLENQWAVDELSNIRSLTAERIDEVITEFFGDFKEGSLQEKGWPTSFSAYKVSKAALNAYTRILANQYPSFRINNVCPGYCRTDMTGNFGLLSAEEGAESAVKLAFVPDDGPTGLFFYRQEVSSF